jgi:hypothetical protein
MDKGSAGVTPFLLNTTAYATDNMDGNVTGSAGNATVTVTFFNMDGSVSGSAGGWE